MTDTTTSTTSSSDGGGLASLLRRTEEGIGQRRSLAQCRTARGLLTGRHLGCLKEGVYETTTLDKAFAMVWLGRTQLAIGTKCNKVVVLDTDSGALSPLPLPSGSGGPPWSGLSGPHGRLGVHTLSLSPLGTRMFSSGSSSACGVVWDLAGDDIRQMCCLEGHLDIIFGSDWLDERTVVTCSRDTTLRLWRLGSMLEGAGAGACPTPLLDSAPLLGSHEGRVRDIKFHARSRLVASLGADGFVHTWTAELQPLHMYRMDDPRELLCLAASDSLGMVAAGGLAAVALLDPRAERPAARLKHHDKLGVRSLSLNGDILGCGGASGALHLFDVRAGRWVPQLGSRKELLALAADARCIQQDANYRAYFQEQANPVACYTHAWDAAGTRLAVGGGPLFFGLAGCYLGLWQ